MQYTCTLHAGGAPCVLCWPHSEECGSVAVFSSTMCAPQHNREQCVRWHLVQPLLCALVRSQPEPEGESERPAMYAARCARCAVLEGPNMHL